MKSKKFLSIVLTSLLLSTTALSIKPVYGQNLHSSNTTDISINLQDNTQNICEISEDEYFKELAESNNLSIEQAKILDKQETLNFEKSMQKNAPISRKIDWGAGSNSAGQIGRYYTVCIYADKNIVSSNSRSITVRISTVGKIYTNGSYARKIVSLGKPILRPSSSGSFTVREDHTWSTISDNKDVAYLHGSGAVEFTTSFAASMGISTKTLKQHGFTGNFSVSGNNYVRKNITVSHTENLYR